jgi:hypothetical protein
VIALALQLGHALAQPRDLVTLGWQLLAPRER